MSEDSSPAEQQLCVSADTSLATESPLTVGEDGIPILNEVVENTVFDALAADLTAQLLTDLEPQLQDMVRRAFTDAMRTVALDLKRNLERELNKQLEIRLHATISEIVLRACQRAQI